MADRMTTREAIAIVRAYEPILNDCPRLRDAILLVAAVAEHNHSIRTRKRKQRKQKSKTCFTPQSAISVLAENPDLISPQIVLVNPPFEI